MELSVLEQHKSINDGLGRLVKWTLSVARPEWTSCVLFVFCPTQASKHKLSWLCSAALLAARQVWTGSNCRRDFLNICFQYDTLNRVDLRVSLFSPNGEYQQPHTNNHLPPTTPYQQPVTNHPLLNSETLPESNLCSPLSQQHFELSSTWK